MMPFALSALPMLARSWATRPPGQSFHDWRYAQCGNSKSRPEWAGGDWHVARQTCSLAFALSDRGGHPHFGGSSRAWEMAARLGTMFSHGWTFADTDGEAATDYHVTASESVAWDIEANGATAVTFAHRGHGGMRYNSRGTQCPDGEFDTFGRPVPSRRPVATLIVAPDGSARLSVAGYLAVATLAPGGTLWGWDHGARPAEAGKWDWAPVLYGSPEDLDETAWSHMIRVVAGLTGVEFRGPRPFERVVAEAA